MTASAHAGDHLWAALFLGSDRVTGPQASPQLAARLHEVFGFNKYKLLKAEVIDLGGNAEHWVLARKDFFFRLQPLARVDGEPTKIRYDIFKDGFLIANGVYVVAADTPLFVSGPDLRRGRLIFVLQPR